MTDLLPGISLRHVDTARVRTGVLVDDRTEGEAVVLVHGNVSSSIFCCPTSRGEREFFAAMAAALPTACPKMAQVAITRVELKAAWVTLMFLPAKKRFSMFLEYRQRYGIP